jgi:oxaloacetate decarboxylase beta subunit
MLEFLNNLFGNALGVTWQMAVMWLIGAVLIYLAIAKNMEPGLMLPLGFGAILVNLPASGAFSPITEALTSETGALSILYKAGIENELFPLLLFIGIGAMIDFGPLLSNPKLMIFGAASQFGIFFTFMLASLFGFPVRDAASIAIIGAADGPTSIAVAQAFKSEYLGPIMVAAYSYMALVPIIQPPVIRMLTTGQERRIRMPYREKSVSKITRIMFPIIITMVAGIVSPKSVALVGFLMFGNLLRECGVLNSLSETAQNALANLITIFLGLAIAPSLHWEQFVTWKTAMILVLGLVAFIFDTMGGVLLAKFFNLFLSKENKINPMIGGTGISAFPMSARVVHKMGLAEDPQNFLLMQTIGVNVSGQISSVIAGGLILTLVPSLFPA